MGLAALLIALVALVAAGLNTYHQAVTISRLHDYYGSRMDYMINTTVTYLSSRSTQEAAAAKSIHDAAVNERDILKRMMRADGIQKSVTPIEHNVEPPRKISHNGDEYERVDTPNDFF